MLQDELQEPRWECFLGAQGQALPKGLEKQAKATAERAIGKHHMHTPCHLSTAFREGGGHLDHPVVLCLSNARDPST